MNRRETRWWWVRHAPVPDEGRIYGQRDLDCDCGDAAVFAALAQELPRDGVWVSSHLARTRQTAKAIMAAMALPARPEPHPIEDLAEQHLGEWQGLDRKAFFASRGTNPHAFWFGPAHEKAPGGESFEDLVTRVARAVERLTQAHAGRDIVAVAHGGTIRGALALALGLSPEAALAFVIGNCSITRIDHLAGENGAGLWRVVAVNHRPWISGVPAGIPGTPANPGA